MLIIFFSDIKLLQPIDKHKDQTFFLSQVKQFSLRKCMFPLATYFKSEVREIAKKEGLMNIASKRDSTGICFIGKKRFKNFIQEVLFSLYLTIDYISSIFYWRPRTFYTSAFKKKNIIPFKK